MNAVHPAYILGLLAVFALLVLGAVCWCTERRFHPLADGLRRFLGLPEARWGLLDHAEPQSRREGSVFRHAVTTNGSLLLDWHNALVGRDVNSPTNLQMELFSDGSFAWRTDDGSTSYLPVFPFDWDGDGLKNSVDPEPLSPNSIDAHGTNAEWYRVVCSNVFEVTGTTGVPPVDDDSTDPGTTGILPVDGGFVQFKTNVNTCTYYPYVEEPCHEPTEGPSFSITASKTAVIFEDAYQDSPGVWREHCSTRVWLTVSAYGGTSGGSFTLTTANLDRLSAVACGPMQFPPSMPLAPGESYFATFVCKGVAACESENDVSLSGTFSPEGGGSPISDSAGLTVVKVKLQAKNAAPANPCRQRHTFGVFEKVELMHYPFELAVQWTMTGGGTTNTSEEGFVGSNWGEGDADWMLRCPLYAKGIGLKARFGNVSWPFNVAVLEPSGIRVEDPVRFDVFPSGVAGAGMFVPQYILPDVVNFQEISFQEIPVLDEPPINSGWFTNLPTYYQTHTDIAGAGVWFTPNEEGYLGSDHVRLNCGAQIPLSQGWQYLRIPWGWNKQVNRYLSKEDIRVVCLELNNHDVYSGGECFRQVLSRYDGYDEISADGTVSVSRFQLQCSRPINGDHSYTNRSAQGGN